MKINSKEYRANEILKSIKHYKNQLERENRISYDLRKHEDVELFENCIDKLKKQYLELMQ